MLNQLNNRLAMVAENIAQLESQFGEYFHPNHCRCTVSSQEVFLEYQHDLAFEQASDQAQTLLRLFNIPTNGKERNLLIEVSGKGDTTKLHLDLTSSDGDDLLLQYLCTEFLAFFQKIATKAE